MTPQAQQAQELQALQDLCESGQEHLMRMEYLRAEAALAEAERRAWESHDWDTLSRLYMPLQESRRQRRLRCGEGSVALDLIARGPGDAPDAGQLLQKFSHGQLLVAGWGSLAPALEVRRLQAEHGLYVETFLAAAYPVGGARAVAIVPLEDVRLPEVPDGGRGSFASVDELLAALPAHCVVLHEDELPRGSRRGDTNTYAEVAGLWERLHAPFLAAADAAPEALRKVEGYRKTIRVDYACELAHQKLSIVARQLAREQRTGTGS